MTCSVKARGLCWLSARPRSRILESTPVRQKLPKALPGSVWKVSTPHTALPQSLLQLAWGHPQSLSDVTGPALSSELYFPIPCLVLYLEKANRFTEELADLQVEEKGRAVFTCKTEHPASVVTWRKGLLELRTSAKHVPSQEGLTLKLTINALERTDSDTYTCDIGQAQTQARLLVHGKATHTCVLLLAL